MKSFSFLFAMLLNSAVALGGQVAIATGDDAPAECADALAATVRATGMRGAGVVVGRPTRELFQDGLAETLKAAKVPAKVVDSITSMVAEVAANPYWDLTTTFVLRNLQNGGYDSSGIACFYYGDLSIPGAPRGHGQANALIGKYRVAIMEPAGLIADQSLNNQIAWVGSLFALNSYGVTADLFEEWRKISVQGTVPGSFYQKHVKAIGSLKVIEHIANIGIDTHVRMDVQTFLTKKHLYPGMSAEEIRARYNEERLESPQILTAVANDQHQHILIDAGMVMPKERDLEGWAVDVVNEIFKDIATQSRRQKNQDQN